MRYTLSLKYIIGFCVVMCIVGTGLEWAYGAFWSLTGTTPWIYPESALRFTSLEVIPLWGFGGLVCAAIYEAIMRRIPHFLLLAIPPLILAALWILFWSRL